MRKHYRTGIGAGFGMLILIFDGKTAMLGAQTGIELCLQTVIPSLFPFFLLSILLTSSFLGISIPFLRPIGAFCGIPKGAESILVSAFLGGYPVGAQSIAEAYHSGNLPRDSAQRMLAFCNNAGPAFLFGMVASIFPERWIPWALWGIQIVSAFLVAWLIPHPNLAPVHFSQAVPRNLTGSLSAAIRVMASVCGWVVLFRVVIAFLDRWLFWFLPETLQVALTGILELSNGCCELPKVVSPALRFVLCAVILSFGGVCVTMQTLSVTTGLSMRCYFTGKLLQTFLSLLLSLSVAEQSILPLLPIVLLLLFAKVKNRDSIPQTVGV